MDETLSDISGAAVSAVNETFVKQTTSFVRWIKSFVTWENLFKIIGALIVLFLIWIVYKLILRGIKKIPEAKISAQTSLLVRRLLKYILYISSILYILSLFGVKLSAIWGAAGIAGVAIGFAAQTSISNLISGLFVLTEGSIHVGDTIIVDGITGVVDAVNLLSVRVHTYDNQMVRIPNSTIINNNLINNSIHDKRRLTVTLDVEYDSDLNLAMKSFLDAAKSCPTVVEDPDPKVWIDSFGDSGVNITVAAWFNTPDFLTTKTDLHMAILKEMEKNKIETPYNRYEIINREE